VEHDMTDTLAPLILDFLEFLAVRPRPYAEVMEAWRTSCPRLTVWEAVNERGFIARQRSDGAALLIDLTPAGRRFLESSGRRRAAAGARASRDASGAGAR
jgi:hypothetical protein